MDPHTEQQAEITRRTLLGRGAAGLGGIALASLLGKDKAEAVFDPEAEYIRRWLPELSSVKTEYLVTGKIPPNELEALDYPAPIVDHKVQQRLFKALYQETKTSS